MKTSSNFKMAKQTKIMLALTKFRSSEAKTNFRKLMIESQLYGSVTAKPSKGDGDNS